MLPHAATTAARRHGTRGRTVPYSGAMTTPRDALLERITADAVVHGKVILPAAGRPITT